MKKLLFIFALVFSLGTLPIFGGAITITNNAVQRRSAGESEPQEYHSDKIYLLRWHDNKMLTTKGTFITDGAAIINESGIDKSVISSQKNPPVVHFNSDGNTITRIIILPNS